MNILANQYPKVDTRLEDAAFLKFYFPNPDGPGAPDYIRTCPFFENPTIKENRSANLIKYDPIGRTGTLFGYTGAKSRAFDVNFTITLPLLLQLARGAPSEKIPTQQTKEEQKNMFFQKNGNQGQYDADRNAYNFESMAAAFSTQFTENEEPVKAGNALNKSGDALQKMYGPSLGFPGMSNAHQDKQYIDAVNLIKYWANLIRSSVLTYSPNPSVGPPIVRFTFGTLFQNIPTVVEKYSMTIDDKAGFDVLTLLPKRINFSLSLSEIRADAGTSFETGNAVSRDRIIGWEAVVGRDTKEPANIDPGRRVWTAGI
jgi:hypothetical protein